MINKTKLRIAEIIALVGLGIGVIARLTDSTALYITAIVLMVAGIISNLFLGRCPYCKMPLHRGRYLRLSVPSYCPRCGKHIIFDE